MMTRRAVTIGATLTAASTALAAAGDAGGPAAAPATRITVPFVTDRVRLPEGDDQLFGSEFPNPASPRMVRGTIDAMLSGSRWVMIPSTLRILSTRGALTRGADNLRALIETGDPVASAIDDFLKPAAGSEDLALSGRRKIFFVHGYRNTFADSISSAAQLAHNHGASDILCFSWPTRNDLFGYWHD